MENIRNLIKSALYKVPEKERNVRLKSLLKQALMEIDKLDKKHIKRESVLDFFDDLIEQEKEKMEFRKKKIDEEESFDMITD